MTIDITEIGNVCTVDHSGIIELLCGMQWQWIVDTNITVIIAAILYLY